MGVPLDFFTMVWKIAVVEGGSLLIFSVYEFVRSFYERRHLFWWESLLSAKFPVGGPLGGESVFLFNSRNRWYNVIMYCVCGAIESVKWADCFIIIYYGRAHEVLTIRDGTFLKKVAFILDPLGPLFGLLDSCICRQYILDLLCVTNLTCLCSW